MHICSVDIEQIERLELGGFGWRGTVSGLNEISWLDFGLDLVNKEVILEGILEEIGYMVMDDHADE